MRNLFLFVLILSTMQVFSQYTTNENQKQHYLSSKDAKLSSITTNEAMFYVKKTIKKNSRDIYIVKDLDLSDKKNTHSTNSTITLIIDENAICGLTDQCLNYYLSAVLSVTFYCDDNGINVVGDSWEGKGLTSIKMLSSYKQSVEDAINCDPVGALKIKVEN